jgi:hypothetical protein
MLLIDKFTDDGIMNSTISTRGLMLIRMESFRHNTDIPNKCVGGILGGTLVCPHAGLSAPA